MDAAAALTTPIVNINNSLFQVTFATRTMRLQSAESSGPAVVPPTPEGPTGKLKEFTQKSTSLPFGQSLSLATINGPTYVTAQTLVQQVAYGLSDRLWTYCPESFGLDLAVKDWSKSVEQNANGYPTTVHDMQIRHGAASIALGYAFSKDFDVKKRHIPQGIIATASALKYLYGALDQLSLLYSMSSPFVAHVAAVDYAGASSQLVSDYISAMSVADELGLGLITTSSAHEAQHMSLFATLLADVVPTIHVYDGVCLTQETTRVVDVLGQSRLKDTYKSIQTEVSKAGRRRSTLDDRTVRLLQAFNEELGTEYGFFEYKGHASPEVVLVVLGSMESSLAMQIASSLGKSGEAVGVVNVRVYRPFVEDEFLRILPSSVKAIGVLGQVMDALAVADPGFESNLYRDVAAAISFSDRWKSPPVMTDMKYPRETLWTPELVLESFEFLRNKKVSRNPSEPDLTPSQLLDLSNLQQYVFWGLDSSPSAAASTVFAKAIATDSVNNVSTKTNYDNLVEGGVVRTDIRKSRKSIDAQFPIDSADVIFVGTSSLFNHYDVLGGLKDGGKVLVCLSGVKDDDIPNRFPQDFRHAACVKKVQLYIFDPTAIPKVCEDPSQELHATQLAFLRVALPGQEKFGLQQLSALNGSPELFESLAEELGPALRVIEIPEDWKLPESDVVPTLLPAQLRPSSFEPYDKGDLEPPSYLKSWQVAAKGLAFKEAYGTQNALRPELATKTYEVHVKENRRLTPSTYGRNIFHIEFDLGTSGLKYDIGEALGIHAENDEKEVADFIKFYNLDPEEVVEVPSRENPQVLENRTVWQALKQNVDIFGRPPKRFYEALSEFADDPKEEKELKTLGGPEGAGEFKRRAEVDTVTYADILLEFSSAHPSFHDIFRIVSPMKRREYSIASCQKVTPNSVALMIVVVNWVDPQGRDRFGQATRYLNGLHVGAPITVSIKPSVMKLPPKATQPLIMAGLGTGLAPFRAFVQHRALEKAQGKEIGSVLLYMGSRHQREEYCYGEEWEAYQDAGVITLLGRAFSRDQPQKIYIQDRMRQTLDDIIKAYIKEDGSFYLCGPTWPVPDVTNVLEEAIARNAKSAGKKIDPHREIENLKDQLRYVLEVY